MTKRAPRKVLLVTPYFAPQSHAAMFRVHKLAKYLPRYGWKPYVLTTDTNYLYREDPGLLDDLPPEVEVHRARYIEPTLRGLRMAAGGRPRALKEVSSRPDESKPEADSVPTFLRQLYLYFLRRWVQVPDALWPWMRPALNLARKLVEHNRIEVVYTTFPPYTSNLIGVHLRQLGCHWVADYRDPGTYFEGNSSHFGRPYLRQLSIERQTLTRADLVTCASSAFLSIFKDMHGFLQLAPMEFIPTGADDDLVQDPQAADLEYPYLLFAGEYLTDYEERFFQILSRAFNKPELASKNPKLIVAGNLQINRPRVDSLAEKYSILEHVEFMDHMPQRELYGLMRGSRACVLVPGNTTHWWRLYAKLVDFIALGVPVVATVPNPSEARTRLEEVGMGIFLDEDPHAAASQLARVILEGGKQPPAAPGRRAFLASVQAERFAALFDRLALAEESERVGD
jgi:glycosyltransferase involved in cell wall biosynthesis